MNAMTYGAEHLLACCMEHPETISDYGDMSGRFGDAVFNAMYKAICESFAETGETTPQEVIRRMELSGIPQDMACETFGKINSVVIAVGGEHSAEVVNGRWRQAQAAAALEEIRQLRPEEVGTKLPAIMARLEEEEHAKVKGISDYLKEDFTRDIKENSKVWKTGFDCIDRKWGGLRAGLYVIGAPSSVGKTTFCLQLADQVAASGEHVIFFSFEQSRVVLACKSLARYAALSIGKNFQKNTEALSAMEIISGISSRAVEKAKQKYMQDVENRMTVVVNIFASSISDITRHVKSYAHREKVKPLVIVDYLQIIQSDKDQDRRQNIDYYMGELKKLSNCGFPVIVVSSYNRTNYDQTGAFECFKESGGIEYSADVACTMELSIIRSLGHQKLTDNEKRYMIDEEKAKECRDIDYKWLKNRYGVATGEFNFHYYPKHELFEEIPELEEVPF